MQLGLAATRQSANALLSNNKVFATPHLGAATHEAQDYVAIELAEQIRDYAHKDETRNVLNLAQNLEQI